MRTIVPKNAVLVPQDAVRVFAGHIFDTYQWNETMFDGSVAVFEMLKRDDSVEVLVVNENKLLIQKQEQPFFGEFLSFPGGRHDHPEETELEAAQRELKEETGLVCASWKLIKVTQSNAKIESFLYQFVAWDIVERTTQNLDAGERIENVWLSLEEVMDLVPEGIFRSSMPSILSEMADAAQVVDIPEYRG